MNSEEINARVEEIEGMDPHPYEVGKTGKAFPYIGWFWREVDFDYKTFSLGVIHGADTLNGGPFVGFMQNNKWGYGEFGLTEEETKVLRALFVTACEAPSTELADALKAINEYVYHVRTSEELSRVRGDIDYDQ